MHEANDNRSKQEQEEAGTPPGVKKVQDVGVFAITTVWSIIAYLWLYIVLIDGVVKHWEAYLTLGFFFALILMAYIADCLRRRTIKGREDDKYGHGHEQAAAGEDNKQVDLKNVANLELVDFYNTLLPQEAGQKPKTEEEQKMSDDMKEFLLVEFGTTKVSEVNKEDLKAKLDGPAFIERIGYRKAVATNYKKEAIAKGQILRRENKQASILKEEKKNPKFGFSCLHYSVSEAAGAIKINILNKTKAECTIWCRTKEGDAQPDLDYKHIDEEVVFKKGQAEATVSVQIVDDDGWEPDEDFYVELYSKESGDRLNGDDTITRVTILDDDKPGMLVFEEKKAVRHPANEDKC